ncbi:Type 1 glutamine amidotransferase-like domain-containing protein [Raoultibacter phocaeensis]|uniref:Type 1 glutamine amidotransferase-like domain-containing protein n=1 Tax=Raoultibacter phocaeensis TaxID=2479841 RepID=UPI00111A0F45|nr:Type 1 glutamine amidotransferase-like domain-containing protein [Raoultibacter phocaeensis]
MKTLVLVSMFQNVAALLPELEFDLKGKTVTYIPTASRVEKLGFFIRLGKRGLKKLGMIVDELDVSTASYEVAKAKLEKNDCIYVAGGNTFYLLQEMKRTGVDRLIAEEVDKGTLYIGESAGAIVAAPDIEYSAAMDDRAKAPDLENSSGLGLTDFYAVPHSGNWEFDKAVKEIVASYGTTLDLRVITDNEALVVEGESVRVVGR